MALLIHILIAVSGLISATYGVVSPSRRSVSVTWVLTAATFITGTYLVLESPAHMLQACVSGLVYLAVALSGILVASRKLATAPVAVKKR